MLSLFPAFTLFEPLVYVLVRSICKTGLPQRQITDKSTVWFPNLDSIIPTKIERLTIPVTT